MQGKRLSVAKSYGHGRILHVAQRILGMAKDVRRTIEFLVWPDSLRSIKDLWYGQRRKDVA